MMVLIGKTNIDFIGKRYVFFAISALLIAAGAASMAVKGLNLGLDQKVGLETGSFSTQRADLLRHSFRFVLR